MKTAARTVLWISGGIALLFVLVALVAVFAVNTATGTRWALNRVLPLVNASPDMNLSWNNMSGTLLGGLQFDELTFTRATPAGGMEVGIARLTFAWQPLQLLKGTLQLDEVRIDGLSFQSEDDGTDVTEPLTPAGLQDMLFSLPVAIELRSLTSTSVQLDINGSSFAFDGLTGAATLDETGLQLRQLDWQQQETRVTGVATLDASLAVDGDLVWQTRISDEDYAGNLHVTGSLQQLALEHALAVPLQVQSTGTVVPAIFADEILNLDLRHVFDVLDLAPFGQPGILLQQGEISTSGSPDALAIAGALQALVEDFDVLDLSFNLLYAPDRLSIDAVHIASSQIDFGAQGALLLDPLQVQLNWELNHLDPGESLPAVQLADTSGAGSILLTSTEDSLDATLVLERLDALLNDYPLSITGELNIVDSALGTLNLLASNQDNSVRVSGSAGAELALDWQIQAPALAQLWEGLEGRLTGEGTVTGTVDMPQVNGELNGQQLRLAGEGSSTALESLSIRADYSNAANDIQLTLAGLVVTSEADGVQTDRQVLEQAQLQLSGTPEQHVLTAEMLFAEGQAGLRLEGAAVDTGWQGTLQSVSVQSDYGNWQLQNPVQIAYLEGAATLGETCLRHAPMEVCLEATRSADAVINADLGITGLPLVWLNPADPGGNLQTITAPASKPPGLEVLQNAYAINLPDNVRILGGDVRVDAAVRNFSGSTWDSIALEVLPVDTVVQISQEIDTELQTVEPLVHRFTFHDASIVAGNSMDIWQAALGFQVTREDGNTSVLQGGFQGGGTMTASGDLDGSLAFDFNDVAWVESFAPQLREARGSLNGTATVQGNRDSPVLTSQLHLSNGGFEVPEYGLTIADVDLMVQSNGNNDIALDLSARSGEGTLALNASISDPLLDSRRVNAEVRGDDFQVWNAASSRVAISPDLQLEYAQDGLNVSGRVVVPEMNLDLAALLGDVGGDTVTVSRDVVVIKTQNGDETFAAQQGEMIPVTANVTLVLGDNVMLRGFGLNASLTGELSMEQAPNRPLLVYGELIIPEGSYEIYNQQLGTRNGRLMFFGNPANPVVDIRAFRETANAEVGMQLSGSINSMRGELYSTPTLPDGEILSLLITGKSFNNVDSQDGDALLGAIANFGFERSQGLTNMVSSKLGLDSVTVGSEGGALDDSTLGLGKYITPDLLMRYKVGIFDRQSILSIEYNLSERLKLMVETGISQSVDLSYTIEKD